MVTHSNLSPDQDAKTVASFAQVIELLAKAGAYVVAATLIAYGLGWRAATTYYAQFGAGWISTDLRGMELLSFISGWGLFVLLILLNNIANLAEGSFTAKGTRRTGVAMSVGGFLSWAIGSTIIDYCGDAHTQLIALIFWAGAWMWGLAIACDISSIVSHLRDSNFQWRGLHLEVFHFIAVFGLFQAPYMIGIADGQWNRSPTLSPLATVVLSDGSRQRLLRAFGENLILVDLDSNEKFPPLRAVKITDALRIQNDTLDKKISP